MSNTSATGGYLAPLVSSPPTEDTDLDAQLQAIVVGITGLDGTLVRPRWQPVDPKQPAQSVNWCAVGVMNIVPDANAYIVHRSYADINDPQTHDEMQRHEVLEIMASFYGPSSYGFASVLRDGFSISQNREALTSEGMGFVDIGPAVNSAELINQIWTRRADVTFHLRRIVVRSYAIENILSAPGAVKNDNGLSDSFNATEAAE